MPSVIIRDKLSEVPVSYEKLLSMECTSEEQLRCVLLALALTAEDLVYRGLIEQLLSEERRTEAMCEMAAGLHIYMVEHAKQRWPGEDALSVALVSVAKISERSAHCAIVAEMIWRAAS